LRRGAAANAPRCSLTPTVAIFHSSSSDRAAVPRATVAARSHEPGGSLQCRAENCRALEGRHLAPGHRPALIGPVIDDTATQGLVARATPLLQRRVQLRRLPAAPETEQRTPLSRLAHHLGRVAEVWNHEGDSCALLAKVRSTKALLIYRALQADHPCSFGSL